MKRCTYLYEQCQEESLEIEGEFLTEEGMKELKYPEPLTSIQNPVCAQVLQLFCPESCNL